MSSYIYVIKEEGSKGAIKVGISKHPLNRLKQLQTGNPKVLSLIHVFVAIDHYTTELQAHALLKQWHIRGEWFEAKADLRLIIKGIKVPLSKGEPVQTSLFEYLR